MAKRYPAFGIARFLSQSVTVLTSEFELTKYSKTKFIKTLYNAENPFGIMKLATFFNQKEFSDEYHNTFLRNR